MTDPDRVYFDANPFIYAIEGDDSTSRQVKDLFEFLQARGGVCVTSELTLVEVLPKATPPQRRAYLNLIAWSGLFDLQPVSRDVLVETADYRRIAAQINGSPAMPKLPDAIHIVTAIRSRCKAVVTSDLRLKLPTGLSLVVPGADGLSDLQRVLS